MKLPTLAQIDAELAKRSLKEFIRQAWHVLEPVTPYVGNWHIDAITEHLEAVSKGQITKLIINVPPGHMKSLSVCVFWPAWEWIAKPHLRWLFASYAAHLSIRDSIKTRMLISSDWYQKFYGGAYSLVKTNEQLITNNRLGFRYATSVNGVGTGERVHRVINDDLLNATDAQSDAMRLQAINHLQAMASRGVPTEPFGQILIMQRLHQGDPTGWAIEQGGWEQLILPAEFESTRRAVTSIGFSDPRQQDGELLWPTLFDHGKVADLKKALGVYGAAAQLQQRPSPLDGGIIKAEWFKDRLYKNVPDNIVYTIQSWDTAFKTGALNDYSVCTTWGITRNGEYYLLHRYKAKIEFPELKKAMVQLWKLHNPVTILIEDKASGQSLIQEMQRPVPDPENPQVRCKLPIKPVSIDTDKITRVNAATTTLETNVYLPADAPWLPDYLDTLTVFPNGAHDDDVDSTTQFINYANQHRPRAPQNVTIPLMGR